MNGGYVAITDNADPMNVVVYRTSEQAQARASSARSARCPVFEKGASATENSLIGAGRSLIVENNYGYQDPFGPNAGAVTQPGFARVDVNKNGKGCKKKWTNHDVRAPTVVPKLSTKTGLIYTYARPAGPERLTGLLLDRDRLPHRQDRVAAVRGLRAWSTTTTTPASRSAPTAPPTSA